MTIVLLVEGRTERVLAEALRAFLQQHLAGRMPQLHFDRFDGRLPKQAKLKKRVHLWLNDRSRPVDAVIALTDVYTGSRDFEDAADAKRKVRQWVGNEPRFHPHAAQYEFEAWLLPYWSTILRLAGHQKPRPAGNPERVNHTKPPSHHLSELFRAGTSRTDYVKTRDAKRILRDQDLSVAARECAELASLLNTLLQIGGAAPVFPEPARADD